jgi:hypothetical protein
MGDLFMLYTPRSVHPVCSPEEKHYLLKLWSWVGSTGPIHGTITTQIMQNWHEKRNILLVTIKFSRFCEEKKSFYFIN